MFFIDGASRCGAVVVLPAIGPVLRAARSPGTAVLPLRVGLLKFERSTARRRRRRRRLRAADVSYLGGDAVSMRPESVVGRG